VSKGKDAISARTPEELKKDKPLGDAGFTRRIVVTVLVLAFFVFVYFIRHVFVYLTFSVLLAYLIATPVDFLQNRVKLPRTASVILAMFGIFIVLIGMGFIVIPPIADEFNLLIRNMPDLLGKLEIYLNERLAQVGTGDRVFTVQTWLDQVFDNLKSNLPDIAGSVFTTGFGFVSTVTGALFGSVIVPVMSYYLVKDSARIRRCFELIIPGRNRAMFSNAIESINTSLGGYIRGQILLCLIIGIISTLGLLILGVKYAFVLGLLAGITELIPMAGPILGCIPAIVIAFTMNPILALKVLILYMLIQAAENYFLVPRVMGRSMNMHPLTVIIAMMIGARMMGVAGMFLALPIAAIVKIIMNLYLESRKQTNDEEPQPAK
jgi:predicted PurR-regulated permease PerM